MSAPRRWGYTRSAGPAGASTGVCPTQVGIHLWKISSCDPFLRLPHAGGDTPVGNVHLCSQLESAPRRWGYTRFEPPHTAHPPVCPTQVGIHPPRQWESVPSPRLPHAGGDTPCLAGNFAHDGLSAPRRWGYTPCICHDLVAGRVCPTQVGIHPARNCDRFIAIGLPHAGGDTPGSLMWVSLFEGSAPRRWGYTDI